MEKAVMILWSLWRQRNEKLGNNTQNTSTQAKGRRQIFHSNSTNVAPICKRWHKPPPHFLKCNTDAALFTSSNMFGLSCVLRDENGEFMVCRMQHCDGNPTVKECEVLALLKAII
ncbi:uncharacterized protein [Primulina huaijiensis]|uniref:uncharacterized protein n=1 Tax=Primulina huaijiensis TaxID=1492673 RepID=UPI003CC6E7A2